jgi:phospholipase C
LRRTFFGEPTFFRNRQEPNVSELTRKDFLKAGAVSATAVALQGQPAVALAQGSRLNDIDHFIILMQENRSFDHYFGTLRGVRGFNDSKAIRLANGRSVFYQPDPLNPDGYELPFHLDTKTTSAQKLHDLSHEWSAQHASWNGGKMDNWVPAHRATNKASGPLTMGYYTRADIPFHYALADAFTICDGYFCSVLGPTYPNRLYHWTATVDPDGKYGGPATNNAAYDGSITYSWETYPERLEKAGVSWQFVFETDDYALNVMRYFANYKNAAKNSALHQKALTGRPFATFLEQLRAGDLPQVTWMFAQAEQCEHPAYMPIAGADYIRQTLEALWSNPALWARTAVIINYDENDGQFDHVAPPAPNPGTPGEFIKGLQVGLGFRVPCFVISPFSRGGYVANETFDHTSVLRLLETRFGVEVPNLTAWRRGTTGDLTSAFGFGSAPDTSIPDLPETAQALVEITAAVGNLPRPEVPATQRMPTQEPGTRPQRGTAV